MDYAVTNPATGETVTTYDTITDAELESRSPQPMRRTAPGRGRPRSRSARRSSAASANCTPSAAKSWRSSSCARWASRSHQALGEVDFAAAIYAYYAEHSADFLKDEPIQLLAGDGSAVIRRSSLGVLLGIMPWNFPYYQVARFAGPNLIIGNTILLKHAEQCPGPPLRCSRSSSRRASRPAPT